MAWAVKSRWEHQQARPCPKGGGVFACVRPAGCMAVSPVWWLEQSDDGEADFLESGVLMTSRLALRPSFVGEKKDRSARKKQKKKYPTVVTG